MTEPGDLIGKGYTADVYDAGDGLVMKLFKQGYPEDAVRHEYRNSLLVNTLEIPLVKSHGLVCVQGRHGILYDRAYGEPMQDALMRTLDLDRYARLLARIHRELLGCRLPTAASHKAILSRNIGASPLLSASQKEALAALLDGLADGDGFCHGDFHFGNVLLDGENWRVIDYMNVCRGDMLGDVARTVYLVELTPVPPDIPDHERFVKLKREAAGIYLDELGIARAAITGWLTAVTAARLSEVAPDGLEAQTILERLSHRIS